MSPADTAAAAAAAAVTGGGGGGGGGGGRGASGSGGNQQRVTSQAQPQPRRRGMGRMFRGLFISATVALCLILSCCSTVSATDTVDNFKKKTSGRLIPITVHLVPHAHLDVGWLKTADQYYYGSNSSLARAGVQYSFDAVMPQLAVHSNRTWTVAEQAYFQRWWREQPDSMRTLVRKLVARHQLVFVDGGWTQHDEGCLHHVTMLDQTTFGQRFLKTELGIAPRIGWHLDPFGHTSTQAALLCAEVGFDAFFFGRIDYEDRDKRRKDATMEMIWRGSPSLGKTADIFAGALAVGSYCPPTFLSWPHDGASSGTPVMDDPRCEDSNVVAVVNEFVAYARELQVCPPTPDSMGFMGW